MPTTYNVVGQAVLLLAKDFKNMFKWLNERNKRGGLIDTEELRREHSRLLSFEEWLKTESAWKQK
jgi:hypothetical protein